MIISFSGIDSAGKTTQVEFLMKYFEEQGIRAKKVWSKARGTPGVVALKQLLRRDKGLDDAQKAEYRKEVFRNPKKEKLLYIASMLDLCWYWGIYYRVLKLFYKYIVCDRYLWDTYVEINSDFAGIDIDRSLLWKMVRLVSPKPKVSFVFIVPPEVSLKRDHDKNAAGIETIAIKKHKIDLYMKCIDAKCWTNVMNGMNSIEELQQQVLNVLELN